MALRGQITNAEGYGSSTAQTPGTDFARGTSDALLVTATGNATIVLADGSSIALTGLAANTILPFRAKQISTATATIVVLYW